MIAALAGLLGLSRMATIGLLVALALTLGGLGKCAYDRSVIARHELKVGAQVQATASAAAADAHGAASATKSEVEKANAEARDAAARSDDPLAAGLRRLRAEAGPADRPAPR